MSRRPRFSAHDAFNSLDVNSLGYLTKEDFRGLLAENSIYATDLELAILMSRYDRNNDSRVSYAEFSDEMCPKIN